MPYEQCITNVSPIRVTAGYPTYPDGSSHGGIDTVHGNLLAYAPKSGKIVVAHTWQGGTSGADSWGNYIVVSMGNNEYWLAAHFKEQTHRAGEYITAGQLIGTQGATGNVTGTHTHWEYWKGGQSTQYRQDPSAILNIPNEVGVFEVVWKAGPTPKRTKIPLWMYLRPRWTYE